MKKSSQSNDWIVYARDYIAGACGGMSKVFTGQPFDTIKVRVQQNPDVGAIQAIKNLIKNEGPLAFYKGALSVFAGITFMTLSQFGCFGNAKLFFETQLGNPEVLPLKYVYLSGAIAGIVGTTFSTPVEYIRITMQLQLTNDGKYKGSYDALKRIVNQYGVKGVYQGYKITLIRETIGYAMFYGNYENQARYLRKIYGADSSVTKYVVPLLFGGTSGLSFWLATYQFDTIKTRIQAESKSNITYKGIIDCAQKIYKQGGLKAFWRGIPVCLARAFPVNAVNYLVFETTMKLMGARLY